jgi:hypothetical protein
MGSPDGYELIAPEDEAFTLRYRPLKLIDAVCRDSPKRSRA